MRELILGAALLAACRASPLGGVDGGAVCSIFCAQGFHCCNNSCVNLRNDIHNCGACKVVCPGPQPYCDGTSCAQAPCNPPCTGGALCCEVQGPGPAGPPACTPPTDAGTCPLGCPLCV